MRWARSDIGARSRSNITARQRTVRAFLPYLEGDREYAEERQYSDGAYIAAQTAIMVIYDAEGKSFGLPEGLELPGDTSPKEFLREQGIEYHHTDSGGSSYIIPHGEFPAYDELVELRKDGRPVPVDDVPLERIASLCRRALAYRLP